MKKSLFTCCQFVIKQFPKSLKTYLFEPRCYFLFKFKHMAYLGANIIQYFRLYKPLYADWFKIAVGNQSDAFIAQYSTLNSEIC